jgi:pimeloyl-ACP methyl ester carboxylesterase
LRFERKSTRIGGAELVWFEAGAGRPVISLHPAAGLQIRAVANALADHFRVLLPIVPGYEATPYVEGLATIPGVADLFAEWIGRECAENPAVVGHSMGARLASWMVVRHPHVARRLVLMAPSGFRPLDAPPLSFEPAIFLQQLYAHPERRPPETRSPAELEANRQAFRHYGVGSPRDEALDARIHQIACPTLLVGGGKDVRVPPESIHYLHGKIAGSQAIFIDDAAHAIEVDQPEQTSARVLSFLTAA